MRARDDSEQAGHVLAIVLHDGSESLRLAINCLRQRRWHTVQHGFPR